MHNTILGGGKDTTAAGNVLKYQLVLESRSCRHRFGVCRSMMILWETF